MSKGNTFENDILKLILQAATIANIAINATSSPLTNLYVSLHTDDPGETGTQLTNECAYTGYDRVAIARSASGFAVTDNVGSNVAAVTFPECSANGETAKYFGIGTVNKATGAGKLLYSGEITDPSGGLVIGVGTIPEFAIGALTITEG
jgi:hypothetical protein